MTFFLRPEAWFLIFVETKNNRIKLPTSTGDRRISEASAILYIYIYICIYTYTYTYTYIYTYTYLYHIFTYIKYHTMVHVSFRNVFFDSGRAWSSNWKEANCHGKAPSEWGGKTSIPTRDGFGACCMGRTFVLFLVLVSVVLCFLVSSAGYGQSKIESFGWKMMKE